MNYLFKSLIHCFEVMQVVGMVNIFVLNYGEQFLLSLNHFKILRWTYFFHALSFPHTHKHTQTTDPLFFNQTAILMNCLSISASFPLVLVAQSINAVYSSPSLWWCMCMRKTNKDRRRVSAYPDLGQQHHVKRKHKDNIFKFLCFDGVSVGCDLLWLANKISLISIPAN